GRALMLRIIDAKWMDHIDAMDQLRQGISLRAYGQRDPLVEYKFEAYNAFQDMIAAIKEDLVRHIFRVKVIVQPQERAVVENREPAERKPVKAGKRVGRNDACPCGSGKKYKKCCGKGAS
ncbi:MAG: SEC-C metal-binding domain-containing protein, partial [Syntrophomonadaceae bacterium]|nr:SEC-C metal-binding domain-containing protein [Syntrophomonadaceae bacterium]